MQIAEWILVNVIKRVEDGLFLTGKVALPDALSFQEGLIFLMTTLAFPLRTEVYWFEIFMNFERKKKKKKKKENWKDRDQYSKFKIQQSENRRCRDRKGKHWRDHLQSAYRKKKNISNRKKKKKFRPFFHFW